MPADEFQDQNYTSMQQQAGLLPAAIAVPPPIVFPGQISAMLAQGGPGAAMSILPTQNPFAAVGGFGAMGGYPGPSPMGYPGGGTPNPYAGLAGAPSVFRGMPAPPPMYAGPQMATGMFGPSPAAGMFNTPYGTMVEQQAAEEQQAFASRASYAGMGARIATTAGLGLAGYGLGGKIGGLPGAIIGGLGAMYASEHFGIGQFGQNTFMEQVMAPRMQQRAFAGAIEHQSQAFMPFGTGPMGVGFNAEDAERAASQIQDLGNSATFRRQTFDRFNAADLASITQGAGQTGLLGGVRDVEGMTARVREVAKSLSAFMELAQEPDIQRALQTMGNLRASGLNLSETLGAVQSGRSFARLAGMSFQEMAEVGGGAGGAMFQGFGMSAGAGARAGMMNLGLAYASQNAGVIDPAMMSMLRGPQGLAAASNQFSANTLNMPMLAPAMMTAGGGLNANALQSLFSGGQNLFSMTGAGANNLAAMTNQLGIGGLGMAVSMQPMLRDAIGRMVQSQGAFAQRQMEDTQVLGLMRGMGMRGTQGFITAARIAGMDENQAMARAMEVTSPTFYATQRQQAAVRRREARASADRDREENAAGVMDVLRQGFLGETISGMEESSHHFGVSLSRFFGGEEARPLEYRARTDAERRRRSRLIMSDSFRDYMRRRTESQAGTEAEELGVFEQLRTRYNLSGATGGAGVVSGLESVLGTAGMGVVSDEVMRRGAREFVQGGRLSRVLAYGSARDERESMAHLGRTFGTGTAGISAMSDFAQRIATMRHLNEDTGTMAINAGIRMAASRAGGPITAIFDIGNVVGQTARRGTDYRNAFIQSLRSQGVSAEEAGRRFDRDPSLAVQQAAPLARLMMSDVDISNMEASIQRGRDLTRPRGNTLEELERDKETAMQRLIGRGAGDRASRGSANALMEIVGDVTGIGREGSRKQETSRYIISAMAMAAATTGNDRQSQERAQATIRQLTTEASRQGFSAQEIELMAQRAQGVRGRFRDGEGRVAAREFMQNAGRGRTGRDILNTFEEADVAYRQAQLGQEVARGAEVLQGAGGEISTLVRGENGQAMTAQNYQQSRFEQNIAEIAESPERLRRLESQGRFGSALSALIRQHKRGDRNAMRRIQEMMANAGEAEGQAVGDEVRGRFGYRIRSIFSESMAERYAQREISAGLEVTSAGEQAAVREGLNTAAAENEMRQAGIGGAGDALLDASTQLRRVAELFQDTISSGNLGRAVTQ